MSHLVNMAVCKKSVYNWSSERFVEMLVRDLQASLNFLFSISYNRSSPLMSAFLGFTSLLVLKVFSAFLCFADKLSLTGEKVID